MEKKVCIVTTELMQATVRYLETKPFTEVHALIAAILEQCNPKSAAAAPPDEVKKDQESASESGQSPE